MCSFKYRTGVTELCLPKPQRLNSQGKSSFASCLWPFKCSHSHSSNLGICSSSSCCIQFPAARPSIVPAWRCGCCQAALPFESFIDRGLAANTQTTLSLYLLLLSASLLPLILSYSSPSFHHSLTPMPLSLSSPPSLSLSFTLIEYLTLSLSMSLFPPLSLSLIYRSSTPEALTHTHSYTHPM